MFERAIILRKQAGRRRLVSLFALIAIAALFASIIVNAFRVADERREAERWQLHSMNVLMVTGRLEGAVNEALRGQGGHLITGDRALLDSYLQGRMQSLLLMRRLERMTGDNPAQQANVARAARRLSAYLEAIDRLTSLAISGHRAAAVAAVRDGTGRNQILPFLTALREVDRAERRLLAARARAGAEAETDADDFNYLMAAAALIVVLLMAYAGFGAALGHKRAIELTEELQVMATTDALTGLPNRRHLMAGLETEAARAARSGRPLAFALLDIDRFKAVNDTFGHPAGDAVLRAVADALRRGIRAGDLIGRFGGEEFAIVMPETTIEQARWACERLRRAVAKQVIRYPGGIAGHVTVSTGVALFAVGEGCTRLIARADAALYQAKEDGRDRVRLAA